MVGIISIGLHTRIINEVEYLYSFIGPELEKLMGPIKLLLSVNLSVCRSICLSATHFSQNWLISWTQAKPEKVLWFYPCL